ncbi:MAG: sigma-54 dependent transcriptional regulator [Polyangia bacterium]
MSARVLVVDDERSMCELLETSLGKRGFEVISKTSAAEAFHTLTGGAFDVVVTDLNMKGMSGVELCERIVAEHPDTPVVVMTAFGSIETAVTAIRAGAYDFLTKPIELETLRLTIDRAVQHRALRAEVTRLRRAVSQSRRFDELIGSSPAMCRVYDLLDRVCEVDASVLVTGESGTGKEMVARALHRRGKRRSGPFVAINCAAVPENLLESELFGHARGAFTDAHSARPGLFLQASGGTLFLDEIAELPLALQPKLLRALQERTVRAVGSDAETPFDARIVTATNRDLEAMVEGQRFREDLFYRVNVIRVELPPLRERGADVLVLARHFIQHYATTFAKRVEGLTSQASQRLLAYAWPGNVRELQNCIERAVALTRLDAIDVEDLPPKVQHHRPAHAVIVADDPSEIAPLEEVERRYILGVLEAVGGSRTLAAQKLGLDRKTLYRKLEQYGVPKGSSKL